MEKSKKAKNRNRIIDIIMDIPFFAMLDSHELAVVAKHMNYYEVSTIVSMNLRRISTQLADFINTLPIT